MEACRPACICCFTTSKGVRTEHTASSAVDAASACARKTVDSGTTGMSARLAAVYTVQNVAAAGKEPAMAEERPEAKEIGGPPSKCAS